MKVTRPVETIQAIRGSLAHYERILIGEDEPIDMYNCSLCERFYVGGCQRRATGEQCPLDNCDAESPWDALFDHTQECGDARPYHPAPLKCPECKQLTEAMRDTLAGLLAESATPPPAQDAADGARTGETKKEGR